MIRDIGQLILSSFSNVETVSRVLPCTYPASYRAIHSPRQLVSATEVTTTLCAGNMRCLNLNTDARSYRTPSEVEQVENDVLRKLRQRCLSAGRLLLLMACFRQFLVQQLDRQLALLDLYVVE